MRTVALSLSLVVGIACTAQDQDQVGEQSVYEIAHFTAWFNADDSDEGFVELFSCSPARQVVSGGLQEEVEPPEFGIFGLWCAEDESQQFAQTVSIVDLQETKPETGPMPTGWQLSNGAETFLRPMESHPSDCAWADRDPSDVLAEWNEQSGSEPLSIEDDSTAWQFSWTRTRQDQLLYGTTEPCGVIMIESAPMSAMERVDDVESPLVKLAWDRDARS